MHCTKRILSRVGLRAASWVAVVALMFSVVGAQAFRRRVRTRAASGGAKSDEDSTRVGISGRDSKAAPAETGRYTIRALRRLQFLAHFGVSLGIPYYSSAHPAQSRRKTRRRFRVGFGKRRCGREVALPVPR